MHEFALARPATPADAIAAFAAGGDAAFLAGGHTLLPAMKSRLRAPDTLVDLARVAGLDAIAREGDMLWIGATVTHARVAADTAVAAAIPSLAGLAQLIGDPQVRNRGTLGGAVANNDPAADYPAALLALDATVETDRARYGAADFLQGMFTTALADGELILRVGFAVPDAGAYAKFRNPVSRYAMAGVYVARFGNGVRVAVTGAAPGAFRWAAAEAALTSNFSPAAVAGLALDPADLNNDFHASAEYRAHLAGVMLARAIGELR